MAKCSLCPNGCNINENFNGFCGSKNSLKIAKFYLHPFEEPCISGKNGSGTIFFCGCSLKCVFCQNYELSRNLRGKDISVNELANIYKQLEDMGAENINLVNPTHYSDKIIESLKIYRPNIPIVYNTHSYENIEVLKEINNYVDVYLADIKYFSQQTALRYCGKSNYFDKASKAIEFMISSKPLSFNKEGMMTKGVIVRHLVLPLNVGDSKKILDWFMPFKNEAYFNLMSQYTPFGNIENFPELQRKITKREYTNALDYAISLGIEKMFYQKYESASTEYIPKWDF